jgi:hypothetical protein
VGDSFVKTNVIYRHLEADVERMKQKPGSKGAIVESDYKFSYKGVENLTGVHLSLPHYAGRQRTGWNLGKVGSDRHARIQRDVHRVGSTRVIAAPATKGPTAGRRAR